MKIKQQPQKVLELVIKTVCLTTKCFFIKHTFLTPSQRVGVWNIKGVKIT
jgi:hypothetical protein